MTSVPRNRILCLDGRMFDLPIASGVATYARTLAKAQRMLNGEHRRLAASKSTISPFLAAIPPVPRAATCSIDEGETRYCAPDVFRRAFHFFNIHGRPMELRLPGSAGILHWTYPIPLVARGWANIYTVHDAIPLTQPALSPIDGDRHRRLLRSLIRSAARIVTVSEAARAEIVAATGCSASIVVDCGQAVDTAGVPIGGALPRELRPNGYLLVCGSIEPRKNIGRIVDGYIAAGSPLPLVFAGPDGWRADRFAEKLSTPGTVRLPDIDRPTLLALIANARALLMPSLAEGFGLPVAEAMALGTAVVTSRDHALAETAAGAAVLVDPQSTEAIADAIRRIGDDDALRAGCISKGLVRAADFTPERFAARLEAVYSDIAPHG